MRISIESPMVKTSQNDVNLYLILSLNTAHHDRSNESLWFLFLSIQNFVNQGFKHLHIVCAEKNLPSLLEDFCKTHFNPGEASLPALSFYSESSALPEPDPSKLCVLAFMRGFFPRNVQSLVDGPCPKIRMGLKYQESLYASSLFFQLDPEKNLIPIQPNPQKHHDGLEEAGIYCLPESHLRTFIEAYGSKFSKGLLERFEFQGEILGGVDTTSQPGILRDDKLKRVSQNLHKATKPCLFLDRDGVVIYDKKYAYKISDLELIPGIVDLIQWAKKKNYYVIVLTNQAGIAKGYYTLSDYLKTEVHLADLLSSLHAAPDAWYFSPFHPQGPELKWKKESLLRKPSCGMLLKAIQDFPVDLSHSLMVGDKTSDSFPDFPQIRTYLLASSYHTEPDSYPSVSALFSHLSAT